MILDLNDEAAVKKYNDFVRTNWRGQATHFIIPTWQEALKMSGMIDK
ncbi:hypothetical protein [Oenococcus oeni]|nr:hypothetical protein [Oenococcus oeni]